MVLLIFFASTIASILAMIFLAFWAVGPINQARTSIGAPSRFLITDIFWLMVLLQEALAFVTQFVPKEQPEAYRIILGFLVFAAVVLWAGGVSFSSQAGLRRLFDRAIVILIVLPGALLVMIGIPAATVITFWGVNRGETDFSKPNGYYLAWVILIASAILLRVISNWLAARIFAGWQPNDVPLSNRSNVDPQSL